MEKEMETTIVHWGYMGIMEKKMETTMGLGEPNFYFILRFVLLAIREDHGAQPYC